MLYASTNKNLDAQDRRDEERNIAQDRMRGQSRNKDMSEDEIMNRCQQMPLAREGCVSEGFAYPRNDGMPNIFFVKQHINECDQ